ncbi:hypothetical protein [Streptomyces zhihengii]
MTSEISQDAIKHLEFIQAAITRFNSTSFLIKGWAMTLTAGVIGLAASQKDMRICAAGIIPVICFWLLDSYYLRHERMYRRLYDEVRRQNSPVERFSMNVEPYKNNVDLTSAALSSLLLLFYATSMVLLLALSISGLVSMK